MLTADLALCWQRGEQIKPRYIDTGDEEYLRASEDLIALFAEHVGARRASLEESLQEYVGTGTDYVCFFVTTTGEGIRPRAEELKQKGEYVLSHTLQAVAIETAEGFAEKLHRDIRTWWGFPDAPDLSMNDRFKAKYQGLRVSFGYPACPNLADQRKLFALLKPEEIGVQLTEGDMMDPEASVSALVLEHPDARYFGV